eukprot:8840569-Pyramimonas_sp.AAC.1
MGPRSAALGKGSSHAGGQLELPTGLRNVVPGGGNACGRCHWGLVEFPINGAAKCRTGWWTTHAGGATGVFLWSSLWGHET